MSLPAGRRTKWIVLTGWLLVLVIGDPPAGPQLAAALREVPGLTGVTQPKVVAGQAYLESTLTAPPDSQAASATIDRARAAVHAVPGADAKVGGAGPSRDAVIPGQAWPPARPPARSPCASFPLGRLGQAEDVADAALFLASAASAWTTGVTLDIAGGKIMV